ncbi:MAG: HTTM domain-containing protein [Myxococcota bacterium]
MITPWHQRISAFLLAPEYPYGLAFLRIGIALVGLIQLFFLVPYLDLLYGNYGLVQWAIIETNPGEWFPSIGKLCLAAQPLGGLSSRTCVNGVFVVYALALVGLLVGYQTRLFAILTWLTHGLTLNSGFFSLYGVDTMIHICLFYFMWMPIGGAWSVDSRGRDVHPTAAAGLGLRVLQLHLCVIYFDAGIAKLQGEQWRTGEALWRTLMNPEFMVFDFSWLAHFPVLAAIACWSVIIIEVGYAVFIWASKTRYLWIAATVGLHLGIGLMMGLWLFSITMILMTVSAFGIPRYFRG